MGNIMHQNYKLKHAVTAALSLIAIGFQSSSFALGLGDIQVQSHLGQPLKAKLNVLGAHDLKDPSCLRLGSNSDISHVNFKLGSINGGIANLTLTSNMMINEPIVNLSVVAGCESSIKRDYVLLLDPPVSEQNLATQISNVEDVVIVQKIDTTAKSSTAEVAQANPKPATKAQKKKRSTKKTAANKRKKTRTVAKKSTGNTQYNAQVTKKNKPVESQPRLSISSGAPATYANSIGLRLDKQLRFKPDASAAINSENIAIDDEVTVINNRLAHLQAQIAKLQTQNAQLTTENKLKSEQLNQASASQTMLSRALPFLGAGLLLIGGYTGFYWLRRRQVQMQTHKTNAIWVGAGEKKDDSTFSKPEVIKGEDIFSDVDFGIDNNNEDEPAASMESTFESTKTNDDPIVLEDEQQFSVLDHADVFLSHGRATLAIQLLQDHLFEHPKQSVTIWLFLLDLLAKENLKSLYEEIALDCKLHFNVKVAEFSKQESSASESLEDFPHLTQGLESVWNTPAAIVYLEDLIYNNRLEPRAGLSKNLIEELVLLRSMAQENVDSANVIQLDEKKLAIIEKKEALLKRKKAEKLEKMEEAEKLAQEKAETEKLEKMEETETSFEFTLVERN